MSKNVIISATADEIMGSHRALAYDALTDVMLDAFTEMCTALTEEPAATGETAGVVGPTGFTARDIRLIKEHFEQDDLPVWLTEMDEAERDRLVEAFLDLDGKRWRAFRTKYPQSFTKWTEDADQELLTLYSNGMGWSELSSHFGRNTNAIKLRLGKLGIDLGPAAGRSRFAR